MKRKINHMNKLWGYLRKLCKHRGDGVLLMSKMLFLTLILNSFMVSLYAQAPRKDSGVNGQKQELTGRVVSAINGNALQDVSIRIDDENLKIRASKDGTFQLLVKNRKGKIKFSYVGYKTAEINYTAGVSLTVKLIPVENVLEEVDVVSTGYQKIPKERATGSFEFIDNKLFNRKVSTDFVSRLEDVVPGLAANKVYSNRGNYLNVSIRGISTMGQDRYPLVVVDGVAYPIYSTDYGNGNFNNINPNDIENITVLKDAAAASIWGAQSGNGVIVITTKRGKFKQPLELSFNSNLTVVEKPNLYQYPQMSSSDYIDLEKYLFDKGYWNSRMNRITTSLTPVIQLLKKKKEGKINENELNTELDRLRKIDMRDDFDKYIYRRAINQQYNLGLRGGGEKVNTAVSVGYDKNIGNLVTSSYSRFTVKNNTQIKPVKRLTVDVGITYTESKKVDSERPMGYNKMAFGEANYPYMELADANGKPLEVDAVVKNPIYRDTAGGGRLLNWNYYPLSELYQTKEIQPTKEAMLNLNFNYKISNSLSLNAVYGYLRNDFDPEYWQGIGSQYLRDNINYYAEWRGPEVIWNWPVGDYRSITHWNSYQNQGRMQIDFNKQFGSNHQITAIVGTEIREFVKDMTSSVYYGYDRETGSFKSLQYGKMVPVSQWCTGY
ncbi:TonB-dependent receptor plug domain-containing protein [Sphingobacterium sp. SG20118]|uniref:TonB-dependent receptor plug domain-containing protein n=1 Tax=Sphingobacterium sp. SG20118 TaxID=3367156 RepID=UPI0037DFBE05